MKKFRKSVGFTGTQIGMSPLQKKTFTKLIKFLLADNKITSFHHGDCVGADADAHNIVKQLSDNCVGNRYFKSIKI